ncbi:MAG: DUF3800 domain-containing protein [Nitrospira sp. CG24D]|jgi:hypothetical protein|nr:MAG: DUF3800 domain-containing protein [Nitrospira sp. CG24D]
MSSFAYSPIQHLARAVRPSENWGDTLLAMFTVYFDASGKEHSEHYFVVAGFISSAKNWERFSAQWNQRLKIEGVSCFHAVDAQSREKQFHNIWKDLEESIWHAKRSKLWNDLIDIIADNVFQKFSCGLNIKNYSERLSEDSRQRGKVNAYVLCAMACAQRVRQWARWQDHHEPIEYVFDQDDDGWGLLQDSFKNDGFPAPIQKNKCDQIKKDIIYPAVVPLQAADFLANECFIAKKIIRLGRMRSPDRPLVRFGKEINGDFAHFPEMALSELDQHFKKRMPFKKGNIWSYTS